MARAPMKLHLEKNQLHKDVDKAVDDLMSMHPQSSNVCYPLKVETTASDCFWPVGGDCRHATPCSRSTSKLNGR